MAKWREKNLLSERPIESGGVVARGATGRSARSVTVNGAESPLGWVRARGFVSERQFDAAERLRADWERAQLAPRVTMTWDSAGKLVLTIALDRTADFYRIR